MNKSVSAWSLVRCQVDDLVKSVRAFGSSAVHGRFFSGRRRLCR